MIRIHATFEIEPGRILESDKFTSLVEMVREAIEVHTICVPDVHAGPVPDYRKEPWHLVSLVNFRSEQMGLVSKPGEG